MCQLYIESATILSNNSPVFIAFDSAECMRVVALYSPFII